MAAIQNSSDKRRAKLSDLPDNFAFAKTHQVSLKSRQQGYRYFAEGYIHKVSLFFLENESNLEISAKCFRSQRKSEKPHSVNIEINKALGEIVDAYCTCQAGMCGACSHIMGLAESLKQWQLMGLTDVPAHLSCTSLPQVWSVPRGRKIDPVSVPELIVVNPKPIRKKRPIKNTLTECRKLRVTSSDIEYLKSLKDLPISYLVSSQNISTVITHVGTVPVASGLSTHAPFYVQTPAKSIDTICGDLVFPKDSPVSLRQQFTTETNFMSQADCITLEENTRGQSDNPLWKSARKHRLTSSKFGAIIKRKHITTKFIDSLLNPKDFSSKQTSWGKRNEKNAIAAYIAKTGNHVHECGLVVNGQIPFLGASPDGKICENGTTGIIETKCPFSAKEMTIDQACEIQTFCVELRDGQKCLKDDHIYYYQVQGQLMITGASFCDFVVWTPNDLLIQRILPNVEKMQTMLDKLSTFYFQHIKPLI
ncbi:hypothetical protein KUTeg_008811 [Tegillarca granosa]|uniref:SWIM-type domain-containing protein n=1 Tax=Tegillarca granosa TaxID=220873 RepID=A0ABQ9FF10_TEGGR|nr:hypothetical protein KUTeg_014911 [Tegillarca granosa]KAJ8314250.1 hypothetical protein KUTeg_008811 [Tegillarca granosa]